MIETTLLFLGSIIGAGFATGAEIITFFGNFQIPIWLIALIVGLNMFLIITLEIFLFYPKTTTQTQQPHIKTAKSLDVVFVMIYLILFTAMTAGIAQITNYPTCIISLIFSILIALFGLHRLSHLNLFLVLIIIVLITTTALPHLFTPLSKQPFQWNQISTIEYWAILYAGLNCFMFPEFITALARKHKRHKIIEAGAFTAILVTILVGLILSTITVTNTKQAPIPLLAAAPTPVTTIISTSTKTYPQNQKQATVNCSLYLLYCIFGHILWF